MLVSCFVISFSMDFCWSPIPSSSSGRSVFYFSSQPHLRFLTDRFNAEILCNRLSISLPTREPRELVLKRRSPLFAVSRRVILNSPQEK